MIYIEAAAAGVVDCVGQVRDSTLRTEAVAARREGRREKAVASPARTGADVT
jgi:hypothetical protein